LKDGYLEDSINSDKLSGNPGYIKGEPLIAGIWNSKSLTVDPNR
jgi:hypothetical protein